ncbi:MAG: hypothetical protein ACKD6M_03715 [Candidatus Bathyarchaeota archaeon]
MDVGVCRYKFIFGVVELLDGSFLEMFKLPPRYWLVFAGFVKNCF